MDYKAWTISSLRQIIGIVGSWTPYLTMDDGPGAKNPLRNKILLVLIPSLIEGAEARGSRNRLPAWKAAAIAENNRPIIAAQELISAFDSYAIELCAIYTRAEMEFVTLQRTILVHGHVEGAYSGQMNVRWVEAGCVRTTKSLSREKTRDLLQEALAGESAERTADAIRSRFMAERSGLWPLVANILSVELIEGLKFLSDIHSCGLPYEDEWEASQPFERFRGKRDLELMTPYSLDEARARRMMF